MRAVFLDVATVSHDDLDLGPLADLLSDFTCYPLTSRAELPARLEHADIVFSNKVRLDAGMLAGAPRLKYIGLAATGTDNVDLRVATERGIVVSNIRGYCTATVVQHVCALILALTRQLHGYRQLVRDGAWRAGEAFCMLDLPIRELDGCSLGIVGYGELGRGVARAAGAFGLHVVVAARPGVAPDGGRVPLEDLLPAVDILSLHCPLTPATRGLIGAAELRAMKSDSLLINTARGALVDEAALADALRAGHIGGAGIDVLSTEPPEPSHPLLAADIPNLIVTPHVAWAAREARQRAIAAMAGNLRAFLDGAPDNRVA